MEIGVWAHYESRGERFESFKISLSIVSSIIQLSFSVMLERVTSLHYELEQFDSASLRGLV